MKFFIQLSFLLLSFISIGQQVDSVLKMEEMGRKDILDLKPKKQQKVFVAAKVLLDVDEISQITYIITREEIYRRGFSTLVDVLKTIPGFRVSQPGTSQLGEVFLSRGMVGNVYTTILINGLPIKPIAAQGMPIGSQLPIRQAERIEIIMGPSSTLYGSDAMGGVINIVLPEIKRPVEVSSDICMGANGLVEISTSLAGKMGKDKNVFTYNIYGTSKHISNYNINTSQFVVNDSIVTKPNYIGSPDNVNVPEISSIPHLSRMIGGQFKFRDFSLSANVLSRKDHSALGAFPSEISYSDPSSYYGENIAQIGLLYDKKLNETWSLTGNVSFVNYKLDNGSSYTGIDHTISNDQNFMYAQSNDIRIEPIINWNKKKFNALIGMRYTNSQGIGFQNFLLNPYVDEQHLQTDSSGNLLVQNSLDSTSYIEANSLLDQYSDWSYSTFGQVFYKGKRINALAGFRYELADSTVSIFNPNLSVMYKLNDKIRISGIYSKAFQLPNSYYQGYQYISESLTASPPFEHGPYTKSVRYLDPEILENIEFSIRYKVKNNSSILLSYYNQKRTNSLFTFALGENYSVSTKEPYILGYINRTTSSILNGFQLSYRHSGDFFKYNLSGIYHFGKEIIGDNIVIESYRSVPDYMIQFNTELTFFKKNVIGCNFRLEGPFINNVILHPVVGSSNVTEGFYCVDVYLNRKFGKNLYATLKVVNLTNVATKGIFTNWLDGYEFDYAPQLNRWFSVNLSYRLF